jgi:glutaredoxin
MIKLYSISNCPYCAEIKQKLTENNIKYSEINVELSENNKEYERIYKITESDMVPMVLVKNTILVPGVSFDSIDEAIENIKRLIK